MTAAAPAATSRLYYEPKISVLARPVFAAPDHLDVNWIGESTRFLGALAAREYNILC